MPRSSLLPAALAAAAPLLAASAAHAQTLPSFDARTWQPSTDPGASLVTEPIATQGAGIFSMAAWVSYAHHPVTLRTPATGDTALNPVEHQVALDLAASIGITSRVSLGLDVPLYIFQDGTSPLPANVSSTTAVPTSGIGDLSARVKAAIIDNSQGGFGLASITSVSLPTGDRESFMSDGSLAAETRVLAEYSLVVAAAQATLGYRVRTADPTWPTSDVGGITFGDRVPWTLGLTLRPAIFKLDGDGRQKWEVAAHGWIPVTPVGPFGAGDPGSAAETPVMIAASDRIELGRYRDVFAIAGIDVGLNTAVGVPSFRAIAGVGWAPREHDMDHDGVPDDVDQCPEIPEDRDGFEDSDGCPEIDNDDDGIVDKEDACPNVKGVESPDPKKNGCPPGDSDGDGITDDLDRCPNEKGEPNADPRRNGCPNRDRDGDGVPDDVDRCPTQPEDRDGFEDGDGCPDPDDDGDGIPDAQDACPREAGEPSTDPTRNGCPNPDRDGDTYDNDVDKCPDAAETFNGIQDDDGCPDEGGKPLVTADPKKGILFATPLKFKGAETAPEVDPASHVSLRALALELNRHRDWTLAVGARPGAGDANAAQENALAKAFAVTVVLNRFTHRDSSAEIVGWEAVKTQPHAESGIGFLVFVTPPAAQTPANKDPQKPLAPAKPPEKPAEKKAP